MAQPLEGLTSLKTEVLEKLLRYIYRKELVCPLTSEGLAIVGLQYCQESILGALRTLDDKAITAVLICVIAERKHGALEGPSVPAPSESLIAF